jgi:hypothetical protein
MQETKLLRRNDGYNLVVLLPVTELRPQVKRVQRMNTGTARATFLSPLIASNVTYCATFDA